MLVIPATITITVTITVTVMITVTGLQRCGPAPGT